MAQQGDPIREVGFNEDLPSSPWATRFPSKLGLISQQNVIHSALVPMPRVDDPVYYDQDQTCSAPSNDAEYDKALLSEALQIESLNGLYTWERLLLNRHLFFSPNSGPISSGHRLADKQPSGQNDLVTNEGLNLTIYERERIKVDGTQWFSFLRKDRWFDWLGQTPDFTKQERRKWTVDDPKIWEFLRVGIELANRMLKALIKDRNEGLQTILFGPIEFWQHYEDIYGNPPYEYDDTILFSYSTIQEVFQKRGKPCPAVFSKLFDTKPSDEWESRLETLLSKIIWSFGDITDTDGMNVFTLVSQRQPEYTSILLVGVKRMEGLFNSKITLGELCSLHIELATVMVHELMHAVMRARHFEEAHLSRSILGDYSEPFLNARGFREVGHYLDQYLFGGSIFTKPSNHIFDQSSLTLPPPMGIAIAKWNLDCEPVTSQREALKEFNHTSSAWASKLLGEHFWHDPRYPEKSHNNFHRSFVVPKSNELIELDSLPHIYDEDRVLAKEWEAKQVAWVHWRDTWDDQAEDIWHQTPWSDAEGRNKCFLFSNAFAKQDIVTCALAAKYLVGQVKWKVARDYSQKPLSQEEISGWLWHCVGLLMLASIPILRQARKQTGYVAERRSEHQPSREAKDAGHNDNVVARINIGDSPATAEVGESYNMEGKRKSVGTTQMDYLGRIEQFNKLIMAGGLNVPNELYHAIMQAAKDFLADRKGMPQMFGRSHITNWSSKWYFEFPVYNSTLVQYSQAEMKWSVVAATSTSELSGFSSLYL